MPGGSTWSRPEPRSASGCPSGLAPVTYSDAVSERMTRRRLPDPLELPRPHAARPLLEPGAPEPPHRADVRWSTGCGKRSGSCWRRASSRGSRGIAPRARRWPPGSARSVSSSTARRRGRPRCRCWPPCASPTAIDDAAFRARLLEAHGVEIMGAFGPLAGRIWRIGTMAGNARARVRRADPRRAGRRARDRAPANGSRTRSARRASASTRPRGPPPAPDPRTASPGRGRLRTRRGASGRGSPATSPRCG